MMKDLPVYVTDNSSILFNTLNSFGLKDSEVASISSSALRRLLSYKFEIQQDWIKAVDRLGKTCFWLKTVALNGVLHGLVI